jgi:hypothetical protein
MPNPSCRGKRGHGCIIMSGEVGEPGGSAAIFDMTILRRFQRRERRQKGGLGGRRRRRGLTAKEGASGIEPFEAAVRVSKGVY